MSGRQTWRTDIKLCIVVAARLKCEEVVKMANKARRLILPSLCSPRTRAQRTAQRRLKLQRARRQRKR